jgi:hypothetical protein
MARLLNFLKKPPQIASRMVFNLTTYGSHPIETVPHPRLYSQDQDRCADSTKSKSELREINFRIFMEQFKNVQSSLVSSREIFASDLDFLLIVRNHSSSFLFSADALKKGRRD